MKNIKAIEFLLKYKSNANILDKEGYNALFHAVKSRSLEICKMILPYISNINARCTTGENALHIACNLKLHDIAELLIENNININAFDNANEITALHYSVLMGDKKLVELLLKHDAKINVQDTYGNTPLHYSIIEGKDEILSLLLNSSSSKSTPVFNLWNIDGDLPLSLYLKDNHAKENIKNFMNIFIEKSNINVQNKKGESCLYYLVKFDLWREYTDFLAKKKLDIFLKNKENKSVINIVAQKDYDEFIDLVVASYMYNLTHLNKPWTEELDKTCENPPDTDSTNKCKIMIKEKIEKMEKEAKCYERSYPIIKPIVCVAVEEGSNLSFCTFTGTILDILIGLIYLLKTHKNVCGIIQNVSIGPKSPSNPNDAKGIRGTHAIGVRPKGVSPEGSESAGFVFEITWANKKLTLGKNFMENFKKCMQKKRFVIVPLGIEMDVGNHAGYIIYDAQLKELDQEIKYIRPYEFLPKVGFQLFDIVERDKKKIGDPGFCAIWSIWYVSQRLTYKDIKREELVKILIDLIKRQNVSFKNMIRNYSAKIVRLRDDLFKKSNLNINDWINEQYTETQYHTLLENIYKTLQNVK